MLFGALLSPPALIYLLLKINAMETTKTTRRQDTDVQEDLVIQRVLSLPVHKVWKAFTDPEYFKKWWGPKGFTCTYSSMDARVGGKYLNCMKQDNDGKEFWSGGEVKELVPEKKLVITDHFADSEGNHKKASEIGMPGEWPEELLITVNMEEADGATKLHLRHEGVPPEMHDECVQGWNESLDKIEANIS
jgi:uncharacterized protein YndB with AHSA1/START domain